MTEQGFEARLAERLRAYADGGVRPVDRYATAESILAGGTEPGRGSWFRPQRWTVPVMIGLLLAAFAAGTLITGGLPSPSPAEDDPVIGPIASGAPARPSLDAGAGPCAPMVQRLMTWIVEEPSAPIPALQGGGPVTDGDVVFTSLDGSGEVTLGRLDPSQEPPGLTAPGSAGDRRYPHAPGFPIEAQSRIAAAPDGRALALEDGDLGPAGCGDPLVLLAAGGMRRPFPVGAFELVTDLAWAPDDSALYGVRRPTIDRQGRPFVNEDTGELDRGPGTVLRWDTATGAMTELGSPCPDCPLDQLFVSPDGARLASNRGDGQGWDAGDVSVLEPDGSWRTVARDARLLGWASDGSLVVHGDGIQRVALDGEALARWDEPCCHGTGYASLLSPDGTTLAGMTLSDDFKSRNVTLLDVRDGTTRVIWGAPGSEGPRPTEEVAEAISGYSSVAAWAPDGAVVVVLDQRPDSTAATLRLVRTDGTGATSPVTIAIPDLSATLGFPNIGPSVAWLPERP